MPLAGSDTAVPWMKPSYSSASDSSKQQRLWLRQKKTSAYNYHNHNKSKGTVTVLLIACFAASNLYKVYLALQEYYYLDLFHMDCEGYRHSWKFTCQLYCSASTISLRKNDGPFEIQIAAWLKYRAQPDTHAWTDLQEINFPSHSSLHLLSSAALQFSCWGHM